MDVISRTDTPENDVEAEHGTVAPVREPREQPPVSPGLYRRDSEYRYSCLCVIHFPGVLKTALSK
jgi:hypothetical protein